LAFISSIFAVEKSYLDVCFGFKTLLIDSSIIAQYAVLACHKSLTEAKSDEQINPADDFIPPYDVKLLELINQKSQHI